MTTQQARGTIKRYTVAPHISADLCARCWLAPVDLAHLTDEQRQNFNAAIGAECRLVLSHREYIAIHPHRMR